MNLFTCLLVSFFAVMPPGLFAQITSGPSVYKHETVDVGALANAFILNQRQAEAFGVRVGLQPTNPAASVTRAAKANDEDLTQADFFGVKIGSPSGGGNPYPQTIQKGGTSGSAAQGEAVMHAGVLPESNDYRMVSQSGGFWTEHRKEIVCRFESVSPDPSGTVSLIIKVDAMRNSHTQNAIIIRDGSKGKELGRFKGLKKGSLNFLNLLRPASQVLEIAIVNNGGDGLRINQYTKDVPEVYLVLNRGDPFH